MKWGERDLKDERGRSSVTSPKSTQPRLETLGNPEERFPLRN